MTKEDFLNGAGETPEEREKKENHKKWLAYKVSKEGVAETYALMEADLYDGPTGNA